MTSYTTREKKRYFDFRDAVLKYSEITNEELFILISRFTQGDMGRKFFFGDKFKLKYYSYWVKRLHHSGILLQTEKFGLWKVKRGDP